MIIIKKLRRGRFPHSSRRRSTTNTLGSLQKPDWRSAGGNEEDGCVESRAGLVLIHHLDSFFQLVQMYCRSVDHQSGFCSVLPVNIGHPWLSKRYQVNQPPSDLFVEPLF